MTGINSTVEIVLDFNASSLISENINHDLKDTLFHVVLWDEISFFNMLIKYCKISNISRTKSLNLDVSRLILQLSLPNLMKPDVQSRMKM